MEGGIPKGTQIGSYVIDSFLGRGGMGVVYRAYHPRLERWAAIKLLPPFHSSTESRERFEREARAVAKLRHRHILSVFDFGEFAGQPYMVVEYMPNGSLDERMPKEPLTPVAALALLRPLGEALDYAHQQGVLHRDVKPANVFLDPELQPVLADFGLAKMMGEQSLTASGLISGTPSHISPEQTTGRPLDSKSDLYSLAVIAFQLLTGRLPFLAQGMMEQLYAHVNTEPPAPTTINPLLPDAVDAVILRGLAKDPAARWETAGQMIGALEAAAAGRVDTRRPRPPAAAAVVLPGAATQAATVIGSAAGPARRASDRTVPGALAVGDAEARQPPRRRGWLPLAALAAVLVIAIGAGYLVLTGHLFGLGAQPGANPAATPRTTGATPTAPVAARTVSVQPPSPLRIGDAITVSGAGLDPRKDAGAGILQSGAVHPISGTLPVAADGTFKVDGVVPTDLTPGAAALVACNFDASHRTDLTQCIQLNVKIIR